MQKNDITTQKDFAQEMSRFLTRDIAENTIKNAHFWPYMSQVISEDVKAVNKDLARL